jgi:hypothetical protein
MMNEEDVFPRLLELLHAQTINREDGEAGLHRLLMDLLYEMSRVQRIRIEDLGMFPYAPAAEVRAAPAVCAGRVLTCLV